MKNPLQTLLQAGNRPVNNFPVNSRYYGTGTRILEDQHGTTIIYLRRRFIPSAERLDVIQEHIVREGDRLDNIAAAYIGGPEQFWQIADANEAIKPEELTEKIGRRLGIAQAGGIPLP